MKTLTILLAVTGWYRGKAPFSLGVGYGLPR